jgi:hypothetical protein
MLQVQAVAVARAGTGGAAGHRRGCRRKQWRQVTTRRYIMVQAGGGTSFSNFCRQANGAAGAVFVRFAKYENFFCTIRRKQHRYIGSLL